MNILKADAFSNRRGLVLDTFTFADPNRTLELNPSEVDRLRTAAEKVIAGKTDVRELLKNRPKPALPSRKARISRERQLRFRRQQYGYPDRDRRRRSARPAVRPRSRHFAKRRRTSKWS